MRTTSIKSLLFVCTVFGQTAIAQSVPLDYRQVSGCYSLAVGAWTPSLQADSGYHALPRFIRLDTVHATRGGRVLTPDISLQSSRRFTGFPRWEIRSDTLIAVWSNGFTPTIVRLRRIRDHLEGWAESHSDATPPGKPNWPRALVFASRARCAN